MITTAQLHQHIDNGGYTFKVYEDGTLSIAESFFGYATSTVELHHMTPDRLRELAVMLNEAAHNLSMS